MPYFNVLAYLKYISKIILEYGHFLGPLYAARQAQTLLQKQKPYVYLGEKECFGACAIVCFGI